MRWEDTHTQTCSIARATSILGDRWTLLIIRQIFMRIRRFSEIQSTLEISKARLTNRLNRLIEEGIVYRDVYEEARNRADYKLTEKGLDLYPITVAVARWGDKWLDDGDGAPVEYIHKDCGEIADPKVCCSNCGGEIVANNTIGVPGPGIQKKIDRGEFSEADVQLYRRTMGY